MVEGVVGVDSELDQVVWATFDETKDIELPAVTRVVLDELQARIDRGFPHFMPAPFYYELRRQWRREELA